MNTTNALTVFNFQQQEVRITIIDGEPWWLAPDICTVLEHSDVSMAVSRLDEDEKLIQTLFVSGQHRQVWLVNEPGLYHLIFTSRIPKAETFKRWIRHDVLPAIRKTGSYAIPDLQPEQATALAEIAEIRKDLKRIRRAIVHPQHQLLAPQAKPHLVTVMQEMLQGKQLTYTQWVQAGMDAGLSESTAKKAIRQLIAEKKVQHIGRYYMLAESDAMPVTTTQN